MTDKFLCVITTIQEPTDSTRRLLPNLIEHDSNLIVIGDTKGPAEYKLEGVEFIPLEDQIESSFAVARLLPENHYARKNIGYLHAIAQGALCIYETDDDNAPLPNWTPRQEMVEAVVMPWKKWVNAYKCFTTERIWPRGFPLDELADSFSADLSADVKKVSVKAPIQQGLADNSPDVDAVWRLILDKPFYFMNSMSVYLKPGSWCPFNSQSTWWRPEAYPVMYLPSYCSFRMTDIWRSFVAQRCLWEMGYGVVFHGPEVVQERNKHNLMNDFNNEIPGYVRNKEFIKVLEGVDLQKGAAAAGRNLFTCYESLVRADFFSEKELDLIDAWLTDLEKANSLKNLR